MEEETSSTASSAPEVSAAPPGSQPSFRAALERTASRVEEANGEGIAENLVPERPKSFTPPNSPGESSSTESTRVSPSGVPLLAPSDMSAEEKAEWEAANYPKLKSYLARRGFETRAEFVKQTRELENQRKSLGSLNEALARNKDHYILQGNDPAVIFERALKWDQLIQENPIQGLRAYIKAYGVSPQQLLGGESESSYQTQTQSKSLSQEDIQAQIQKGIQEAIASQQQNAARQQLETTVNRFIASKPVLADPGTRDEVTKAMGPYFQALLASNPSADPEKTLESAYKFALAEHFPDLNARLEARATIESQDSEARKALKAGKAVHGSLAAGEPQKKFKGFRDALEAFHPR